MLYGDLLIFSCDGSDDAFVVALDKRTGKVRWKTSRRQPCDQAYSTPLVIRVGERDQLVSVGAYRAAAYDPRTGKEIWRVSYGDGFSNVPRPVFGHGLVYIATGFQQPSLLAVRADGTGDVTKTHVAWTLQARRAADAVAAARRRRAVHRQRRRHRARAWMRDGRDALACSGSAAAYSASPVFADGRIYFLSEDGTATVIAPGKKFEQLALEHARRRDARVDGGVGAARSSSAPARHLYRLALPERT